MLGVFFFFGNGLLQVNSLTDLRIGTHSMYNNTGQLNIWIVHQVEPPCICCPKIRLAHIGGLHVQKEFGAPPIHILEVK